MLLIHIYFMRNSVLLDLFVFVLLLFLAYEAFNDKGISSSQHKMCVLFFFFK